MTVVSRTNTNVEMAKQEKMMRYEIMRNVSGEEAGRENGSMSRMELLKGSRSRRSEARESIASHTSRLKARRCGSVTKLRVHGRENGGGA